MGKFLKFMSQNDSQALKNRAVAINEQAKIAQTNIINGLKQKKTELELAIQNLTDFAPDTTQSLRPGVGGNWNPAEWAKRLQNAKTELYTVGIQLKIAEQTFDEFFGEDETAEAAE